MRNRVLIASLICVSFFTAQLASQAISRCLLAGTEQCSGEQCTTEQCDSPIATACAKSCDGKLATKLLSAVPSIPHSPVHHPAALTALPGDHASLESNGVLAGLIWVQGPPHAPPFKTYLLNCNIVPTWRRHLAGCCRRGRFPFLD